MQVFNTIEKIKKYKDWSSKKNSPAELLSIRIKTAENKRKRTVNFCSEKIEINDAKELLNYLQINSFFIISNMDELELNVCRPINTKIANQLIRQEKFDQCLVYVGF